MQTGVHALLVTKDRKVLLIKKGLDYKYDKNNAGKVAMFGGGVYVGEEPLFALRREIEEELSLDITGLRTTKLGEYVKTKELDGVDVKVHVFVIDGVNRNSLDISRAQADDIEAAEDMVEGTSGELLARPDLTRITRLALADYNKLILGI